MKTLLKTTIISTLLATTALNADFIRVDAGAGMWIANTKGQIDLKDDSIDLVDTLGYTTSNSGYAWILFKHFLPVIPNVRLEYTSLSYDGKVDLLDGKTLPWDDADIPSNVSNTLTINEYDAILYYNILDNTFWTTIDLGLDVKMLDASFKLDPVNVEGKEVYEGYETPPLFAPIPMAYARARVEIPFSGVGVEADVKILKLGDSQVIDARAKVDYTLGITPIIQPGLEVGYRIQKIDIDVSKIESSFPVLNLEFAGIYAGAMLRF